MTTQRPADTSLAAEIAAPAEAIASNSPRPWATWAAVAITLVIFLGIGLRDEPPDFPTLAAWGAPSAGAIWNGAYWGLVTTVFVHLAVWHLAFNVYWLLLFGKVLESAIGPARWVPATAAILRPGLSRRPTGSKPR